jgi:YD repeat-containing protein
MNMQRVFSIFFCVAFFLLSHSFSYARPPQPPCDTPCPECCPGCEGTKQGPCPVNEGSGFLSLTEGNLGDSYDVVTVGSTLDLRLFYNTSMADGYKAAVYTTMGFGWTHSYNIYLTEYRFDLYLTGGSGRTTKFKIQPDRKTYKPVRGDYQQLVKNPDGTLTMTLKDGTTYDFKRFIPSPFPLVSPPYLLTKITDRNDNETLLTYDSTGLLQEAKDTFGRSITFTYDANRRISTIKDPLNRITALTYDNGGYHLMKVTDPAGYSVEYTYNYNNQITSKRDKNGRLFTYSYNSSGRPIAIRDGNGDLIFSLSNDKNWSYNRIKDIFYKERYMIPGTTTKTDGRGNQTGYKYNENGYLTKIIAPDGADATYTYDPVTLNVASETDCNGNTTSYEYDAMGNRTKVTDALGNVTTYEYEPLFNNVTKITYYKDLTTVHSITEHEYDPKGNRTKETRDVGGLNLVREWTYYPDGNVQTEKDPNGHVTTYEYDAYGNLAKVTDPESKVTEYKYDKSGTPGYEMLGNRTKVIDANTHETSYEYDDLDRLIKETDALSYTTEYEYDGEGNRIKVTKQVTKAPDPLTFQVAQFEYDIRNRLFREIRDPAGLNQVTEYGYDGNDNRTSVIDPRGKTTTFDYDAQNRLILITDALGNTTKTRYDCVGNRTCAIDANSHYTLYEYDPLNRLIKETRKIGTQECTPADADDIVAQYFYNNGGGGASGCCGATPGSGNISKIIDAEGKVTYFKYDKVDRRVTTIRKVTDTADSCDGVDDWCEYTEYDPADNVIGRTDANGNATTFTHHDNNWLKTETNAEGETTTYMYDGVGNVFTMTVPGGNVTTNTYNTRNELIQIDDFVGRVANYDYDGVGNRILERDGNGNGSGYRYDAANRLVEVIDAMGVKTTYEYDATGNLVKTTDRNENAGLGGLVVCHEYDDINRRTRTIQNMNDTNCAVDADDITTDTEYDNVGNIIRLTDAKGNATRYNYDEADRLTLETYADGTTRQFFYDKAGNLTERIDQLGQITRYSYNDLYYLTQRDYQDPAEPDDSFQYDTGGRMIRAERNGWVVTFDDYDRVNRLRQTT